MLFLVNDCGKRDRDTDIYLFRLEVKNEVDVTLLRLIFH